MNRITQLFEKKKSGVLSVYFPAGYPALNDTVRVLEALQSNGIDLVEIGIPFSDPMADGPVIQQAATQALENGMSLRVLFGQLKDVRKHIQIPLVLMGYLNPIMQYGFESFCQSCKEVGVDGMIIPDLPLIEYQKDYKKIAEAYGIKMILLISPETSEERVLQIDEQTDGFIYMVSSASTTGVRAQFGQSELDYFQRINQMNLKNNRLIGFGISNLPTLQAAMNHASGAIIGSRFVQLLNEAPNPDAAVKKLLEQLNH